MRSTRLIAASRNPVLLRVISKMKERLGNMGEQHVMEYQHMNVLERRVVFLARRIERGLAENRDMEHDEAEHAALKWAIDTIYEWVELPKVQS